MTNPVIRQLSIDLITDTYNPIIDWFNDLWFKLYILETNVYHNGGGEFIYYYIIDDIKQWVFFQDNENKIFWGNYDEYWTVLSNMFNIDYDEIQMITQMLVENALNNTVTTPISEFNYSLYKVQGALNNGVATYDWVNILLYTRVHYSLNNSVAIPHPRNMPIINPVDNALVNYEKHISNGK